MPDVLDEASACSESIGTDGTALISTRPEPGVDSTAATRWSLATSDASCAALRCPAASSAPPSAPVTTICTGDTAPGLKDRSRTACAFAVGRPSSDAVPRSMPYFSPVTGSAAATSSAAAITPKTIGRRITRCAHRAHGPCSACAPGRTSAGRQRSGSDPASTFGPSAARTAGSRVSAAARVHTTEISTPVEISRKTGAFIM